MRLFGLTITRHKALETVPDRGGWFPVWPVVREPYTGAWQANVTLSTETALAYFAVYACVTLISSDIGKMRAKLVAVDEDDIWLETESAAFSPILRRPNRYQNRIKFFEWWITSKLIHGNTYALKERDGRGVVTALYILDPMRVAPLVAPDGAVFYQLKRDLLSTLTEDQIIVPAREIIHDVGIALFHPLVGVSPLYACSAAATQGLAIQGQSTKFFSNGSNPGGVLTAPGAISQETAERLSEKWATNFGGENVGKIAVLGDGLKYEPMAVRAVDAQLIEQFKWTADIVCSAFHVPPYMIGVGPAPSYNNIEALNQQYYSQCLQTLIESLELALDEGLELPPPYGVEFDLDALLRMDTATKVKAAVDGIGGGFLAPNEARAKFDLPPVDGGDSPMIQQQNFSLAALAERDANKPFAKPATPPPAAPADTPTMMGPADQMPEDMPPTRLVESYLKQLRAEALARVFDHA